MDCDGKRRKKGGVFILADLRLSYKDLKGVERPARGIDACVCLIYPDNAARAAIRLTVVYIAPSSDAASEMLQAILRPENQTRNNEGEQLTHILAGDFKPYTWKGKKSDVQYQERMGESGMWELANPAKPTRKKWSALGRFLILPGTNIPDDWLPSHTDEWREESKGLAKGDGVHNDTPFYPAYTYEFPVMADHLPALLSLKGSKEEQQRPVRMLRVSQLEPARWAEKDASMSEFLSEHHNQIQTANKNSNPTRILDIAAQGIRQCLADQYRRATGVPTQPDPSQLFCKRHVADPEYPGLI